MKLDIFSVAERELAEAALYYESQCRGLGAEFLEEAKQVLERIDRFPDAWQKLSGRVRQCLFRRFPYGIVYETRDDVILIAAIRHLKRQPDYWKSRLDGDEPVS